MYILVYYRYPGDWQNDPGIVIEKFDTEKELNDYTSVHDIQEFRVIKGKVIL